MPTTNHAFLQKKDTNRLSGLGKVPYDEWAAHSCPALPQYPPPQKGASVLNKPYKGGFKIATFFDYSFHTLQKFFELIQDGKREENSNTSFITGVLFVQQYLFLRDLASSSLQLQITTLII